MLRTSVVLGEEHLLPAYNVHPDKSSGQRGYYLNTVGKAGADVRLYYKPVHDYFYGVLFVLFKAYLFGKIVDNAVHPHPHVARLSCLFKLLLILALSAPYNRCQKLDARALGKLHYLINYLVYRLLFDFSAADRTVRDSYSGIQQS